MKFGELKLLAIDDNRDNLTTLKAVVRDALPGCTVLTALSGPQGLELARAEDPDVILLDIVMPGMDGFAVCRELKADEGLRAIPVLFLTALRTDADSRIQALKAGAEGFLSKPWDEPELIAQIRAMAKVKAANRLRRLEKEELENLVAERTRDLEDELAERRRAEDALRESEERYRALFENSLDAAFITVPDGRILSANPAACRMFGRTEEEIRSLGRGGLVDTRDPRLPRLLEIRERTGRASGELSFVRKDGSTFPGEVSSVFFRDPSGELRTSMVVRDVGERKRAEEALQQEARLTRVLLDAFPCPALLLRPGTREVVASNRAAAAVGAVPGATCFGSWGRRETPCPWCLAPATWESGRAQHLEVEASGTVWDAHWVPVADDLYMHYAFDITQRRRAEAERERLLTAIEQAGEGVLVTDAEGTIQYVNPAFEAHSGYARAEILGRNPRHIKSDRHDEAFYRHLWETVSTGQTWKSHIVNKRKDGTLYTEEATISPVRDAGGRIVNYVAVTRDITEHLRLAEQLRQAQKMEAVGRLAGGVAHDFNNLLTVINGLAELAAGDLDPGNPLLPRLKGILDAGTRAAGLTHQLLAFARKQVVAPRVLELNAAVGVLQSMLQRLIGEDIELVWKPGVDAWRVHLDPGQVDQLLANLVVNARDALPGTGKVTVETANAVLDEAWCAAHPGSAPGEYAVLSVSDTGAGMDRETLDHVFEPFFTTKEPGKGTGLGLATVYGIVKQAGGAIYVYSEPGHGTTFRIYLPRWTGGSAAAVIRDEPAAPPRGRETILLVEDEEAILALGRAIFERQGYRVLAARSPAEALVLAEQEHGEIHLLATDVVLPGMNGRELHERLRALRPGVKCLYLSGYTADVIAQRGVLPEGVNFLQKPFSLKGLAAKVRAVLDDVA